MLETLFKFALTMVFVGGIVVCFWGIRWTWSTQIDPGATLTKVATKPFEAPGWVATRDPKKIYQNGLPVGDVTGEVKQQGERVVFAQLANTEQINRELPFEYQRLRLRLVQVDAVTGMKSVVTAQGSTVLTGVMEGVTCEVLE